MTSSSGNSSHLHPATLEDDDLAAQCTFVRQRRSGPGGQHRNKVETAVVVTHTASGIRGQASERRSQLENRTMALHRLRVKLALEVRIARAVDGPSPLWRSRVRNRRLAISPSHRDYPSLLAEALDVIFREAFDLGLAAERLTISASQLTKFLALEPEAMLLVNHHRRAAGLHPLQSPR